jgi:hypothetical protein
MSQAPRVLKVRSSGILLLIIYFNFPATMAPLSATGIGGIGSLPFPPWGTTLILLESIGCVRILCCTGTLDPSNLDTGTGIELTKPFVKVKPWAKRFKKKRYEIFF